MGTQGPITGAGFGHFFAYAPGHLERDYPVARYGMEVKRLCSVLDNHLASREFICGSEYTIADMICLPWFHMLRSEGYVHAGSGIKAGDFLSVADYKHLTRSVLENCLSDSYCFRSVAVRSHGAASLHPTACLLSPDCAALFALCSFGEANAMWCQPLRLRASAQLTPTPPRHPPTTGVSNPMQVG